MAMVETSSPVCVGGGDCMGGFGGSGFIWAFLIFALLMGGNGGFGMFGGNAAANALGFENLATSNEVQRGFDNQNSMANQREILTAVNDASARGIAATNEVYHNIVQNLGDKYTELARDVAGVNASVAQAIANQCQLNGDLKLQMSEGFGQTRFDNAMNTASINATTTAQTQKILDAISGNRIADMQNQINQLQMQNAMSNVVRYPNAWTYNAGQFPSCCCGCGNYS